MPLNSRAFMEAGGLPTARLPRNFNFPSGPTTSVAPGTFVLRAAEKTRWEKALAPFKWLTPRGLFQLTRR
jgi:hypothetical protein